MQTGPPVGLCTHPRFDEFCNPVSAEGPRRSARTSATANKRYHRHTTVCNRAVACSRRNWKSTVFRCLRNARWKRPLCKHSRPDDSASNPSADRQTATRPAALKGSQHQLSRKTPEPQRDRAGNGAWLKKLPRVDGGDKQGEIPISRSFRLRYREGPSENHRSAEHRQQNAPREMRCFIEQNSNVFDLPKMATINSTNLAR